MHLHDINARCQLTREHAEGLACDFRRAQGASASQLNRRRRRRPAPWRLIRFAAAVLAVGTGMIVSDLRAQTMRPVPGAQEIAFETPSGIYLVGLDGQGLRRLPGTRPGDQNPDWSPDGRRLVFWNGRGWHGRIYVSDVLRLDRRLLTRPGAAGYGPSDQFPAWSPDGRLIAFESFRAGAWHIWVMRPDGSGARRVTPAGRGGYSPQWSPDGRRLVYTARWSTTGLAVTDLAGHVHDLKTRATDDWSPAWSPDGKKIVFNSTADQERGEIYVVGARGGKPVRLTHNTVEDLDPRWSPDSRQIVFDSDRSGLAEVYVMNADGTEQRRVTRIPTEYACCASWRPPRPVAAETSALRAGITATTPRRFSRSSLSEPGCEPPAP